MSETAERDVVERLRSREATIPSGPRDWKNAPDHLCLEAAAEISRLRSELEAARSLVIDLAPWVRSQLPTRDESDLQDRLDAALSRTPDVPHEGTPSNQSKVNGDV